MLIYITKITSSAIVTIINKAIKYSTVTRYIAALSILTKSIELWVVELFFISELAEGQ